MLIKCKKILKRISKCVFFLSTQMQNNLWPSSAGTGGAGGVASGCVLGAENMASSCMTPYPHPHGNLPGLMGMSASPGHPHHHHHHHHPPHHPSINGIYSLHGFPGSLGAHSFEPGPESEYKPSGLVALRMKTKDPGSLLSWPTWPRSCNCDCDDITEPTNS